MIFVPCICKEKCLRSLTAPSSCQNPPVGQKNWYIACKGVKSMYPGSWITHHIWTCLLVNIIACGAHLYSEEQRYKKIMLISPKQESRWVLNETLLLCCSGRQNQHSLVLWLNLNCFQVQVCVHRLERSVRLVINCSRNSQTAHSVMKNTGNERVTFLACCQAPNWNIQRKNHHRIHF